MKNSPTGGILTQDRRPPRPRWRLLEHLPYVVLLLLALVSLAARLPLLWR